MASRESDTASTQLAWTFSLPPDEDVELIQVCGLETDFYSNYELEILAGADKGGCGPKAHLVLTDLKSGNCACAVPLGKFVDDGSLVASFKKKRNTLNLRVPKGSVYEPALAIEVEPAEDLVNVTSPLPITDEVPCNGNITTCEPSLRADEDSMGSGEDHFLDAVDELPSVEISSLLVETPSPPPSLPEEEELSPTGPRVAATCSSSGSIPGLVDAPMDLPYEDESNENGAIAQASSQEAVDMVPVANGTTAGKKKKKKKKKKPSKSHTAPEQPGDAGSEDPPLRVSPSPAQPAVRSNEDTPSRCSPAEPLAPVAEAAPLAATPVRSVVLPFAIPCRYFLDPDTSKPLRSCVIFTPSVACSNAPTTDHPLVRPFLRAAEARQGCKEKNEDRSLVSLSCKATHVTSEIASTPFSVLAIFDGHAGPQAAVYAQRCLLSLLKSELETSVAPILPLADPTADCTTAAVWSMQEALIEALPSALTAVFKSLDAGIMASCKKAGTTATVAVLVGWHLVVATCGDSSLHIDVGKSVALGTESHRLDTNEGERDRLACSGCHLYREEYPKDEKMPFGPWRQAPGGLMMSRSLGDGAAHGAVCAIPSISHISIPAAGGRIIMASDGLWDALDAKSACFTIRSSPTAVTASKLLAAALKKNGLRDDVTITVVDCLPDGDRNMKTPPCFSKACDPESDLYLPPPGPVHVIQQLDATLPPQCLSKLHDQRLALLHRQVAVDAAREACLAAHALQEVATPSPSPITPRHNSGDTRSTAPHAAPTLYETIVNLRVDTDELTAIQETQAASERQKQRRKLQAQDDNGAAAAAHAARTAIASAQLSLPVRPPSTSVSPRSLATTPRQPPARHPPRHKGDNNKPPPRDSTLKLEHSNAKPGVPREAPVDTMSAAQRSGGRSARDRVPAVGPASIDMLAAQQAIAAIATKAVNTKPPTSTSSTSPRVMEAPTRRQGGAKPREKPVPTTQQNQRAGAGAGAGSNKKDTPAAESTLPRVQTPREVVPVPAASYEPHHMAHPAFEQFDAVSHLQWADTPDPCEPPPPHVNPTTFFNSTMSPRHHVQQYDEHPPSMYMPQTQPLTQPSPYPFGPPVNSATSMNSGTWTDTFAPPATSIHPLTSPSNIPGMDTAFRPSNPIYDSLFQSRLNSNPAPALYGHTVQQESSDYGAPPPHYSNTHAQPDLSNPPARYSSNSQQAHDNFGSGFAAVQVQGEYPDQQQVGKGQRGKAQRNQGRPPATNGQRFTGRSANGHAPAAR